MRYKIKHYPIRGSFQISEDNYSSCFEEVKANFLLGLEDKLSSKAYSYSAEFVKNIHNLGDLFRNHGWRPIIKTVANRKYICGLVNTTVDLSEKFKILLSSVAPFVEDGSEIYIRDLEDNDVDIMVYVFKDGKIIKEILSKESCLGIH